MRKLLLWLFRIPVLLVLTVVLFLNIRIHFGLDLRNQQETNQEVILQLNYLENELKNNDLGSRMQSMYPEGYVFINALYGLTWCELALTGILDEEEQSRALSEAKYAFNNISSPEGRSTFDEEMEPAYGIFYRSWRSYLLAKISSVPSFSDTLLQNKFKAECEELADLLAQSKSPFPESYQGSSWPSDVLPAIVALKIHDETFEMKYEGHIDNWLVKVKQLLDPETGLIPHYVHYETGATIEGARGSSSSVIIRLLTEIDPRFALEQFELYEPLFSITRGGLPATREYPKGRSGEGDVDSGPVIWGIGFSGSIVAVGTAKSCGEFSRAELMSNTHCTFGLSRKDGDEMKYLQGKMPIADAFIAWSKMAKTPEEMVKLKAEDQFRLGSYSEFHLSSLFGTLLILLTVFLFREILGK